MNQQLQFASFLQWHNPRAAGGLRAAAKPPRVEPTLNENHQIHIWGEKKAGERGKCVGRGFILPEALSTLCLADSARNLQPNIPQSIPFRKEKIPKAGAPRTEVLLWVGISLIFLTIPFWKLAQGVEPGQGTAQDCPRVEQSPLHIPEQFLIQPRDFFGNANPTLPQPGAECGQGEQLANFIKPPQRGSLLPLVKFPISF